jgi:hypothetical protein
MCRFPQLYVDASEREDQCLPPAQHPSPEPKSNPAEKVHVREDNYLGDHIGTPPTQEFWFYK